MRRITKPVSKKRSALLRSNSMSNLPANIPTLELDAEDLNSQTEKLLNLLYPYYRVNELCTSKLLEQDAANSLDCFTFYRIYSCTIEETDEPEVLLKNKMEKYFTALHALNVAIVFGIISRNGMAELVIGVGEKVSESILAGLLPGVDLRETYPKFSAQTTQSASMCGLLSAIPSVKLDDTAQFFDISPIMRSLIGQDYTLFFLASPVDEDTVTRSLTDLIAVRDACFAVSKRTLSLQEGTGSTTSTATSTTFGISAIIASYSETENVSKAETLSSNESISGERQNGIALELIEYAEYGIERLKAGRSCGMWQMIATYSTGNTTARDIIQACLKAELSKPNPKLLPARNFGVLSGNNTSLVPLVPTGMVTTRKPNPLCAMVTSSELGMVCTVPVDNVPNFELIQRQSYPMLADEQDSNVEIGCVTDGWRPLSRMPFSLSESDLNKHTFICGITGSGKTTTVKTILNNCDKPFLVIESAKKEYRNIKLDSKNSPTIYTLGKPELNCPQINPFYIMPGVSPQTHIDFLKDLFNASFSFYGPMPYIFEKCLQNVYIKRGWNLTLGFHPKLINKKSTVDMFDYGHLSRKYCINSHAYLFPTMSDLKNEIARYIDEELQYDGEVAGNVKTAMKTRLESLCNGAKGFMFDTAAYLNMEHLLKTNTIFELEGLADDSDKAFCVGLLLIFINEYRSVQKESCASNSGGLQHLLVVEEAHRLLKNISTDNSSEMMGNPKGKAVEHFTNMIAEMRAYGQGVIIAEQIPTKLAPDAIKNSSNKIIQRVVSADDQQLVANTIGISGEGAIFLGTLKTGFALCHKEGMTKPVCVKVHPAQGILMQDEKLYNKNVYERFLAVNKSIAHAAASSFIDKYALKLLNTLFVCSNPVAISSIEIVKDKIESHLSTNEIQLFPQEETDNIIAALLSESIYRYLTTGVFSMSDLIQNNLCNDINNLLSLPTREKIETVKINLKNAYNRDIKKLGIHIIAQMLKDQYIQEMDIDATINNYFILCDHVDVEDCRSAFAKILRGTS